MSRFECDNCSKAFKRKAHLDYHVSNKVCETKPIKEDKFECKYCGKDFTLSTNMYRHINNVCKTKKSEDKKRDEIYERLLALEEKNKEFEVKNKEFEVKNKEFEVKN